MSVTETLNGIGQWGITLKSDTPLEILDKIQYFGTIAIHLGRVDVEELGDNLLETARYAGQLRARGFGTENKKIGGAGLLIWLGDADQKGYLAEDPLTFDNTDFTTTVTEILPPTVQVGEIHAPTGVYANVHTYQSRRQILDYVMSIYGSEYRIRPNFTVDFGMTDDLYVTQPKVALIRNKNGADMHLKALPGKSALDSDIEDFTTRTVLLKTDPITGGGEITATADIEPELNPYKDFFGNPVVLTRIIQEDQTDTTNAPARAQLQLNRFTSPRDALKLSTSHYDITGDFAVGDYLFVYDPEAKLKDVNVEEYFNGELIHPITLRCTEMTWPIEEGHTVAYRDGDGNWIDLTPYVVWETGETAVTVGGYNRSLTGQGANTNPVGSIPAVNSTIPGKVTGLEATSTTYQSLTDGSTKAQVSLTWDRPLNTDSSIIQDGQGYYVRIRTSATALFSLTHEQLSEYRHFELTGTFRNPLSFTQGSWQMYLHPFGDEDRLFLDLTPGIPYDFQVAAYDNAVPPNVGEWSDVLTVQTLPDTVAPSTPAAPEIYASKAAIQIIHTLGKASGGTFNLENDVALFEVHAGPIETFTANDDAWQPGGSGTMLGKIPVTTGMILNEIPLVATLQMTNVIPMWYRVKAVDFYGNKSPASPAVQMTAELWDDAHIANLTVSKVSAGEILSGWIMSSFITTDATQEHARVDIWWQGIRLVNDQNALTMMMDAETGEFSAIGTLSSGIAGNRVVISGELNKIVFYPENTETRYGHINGFIPPSDPSSVAIDVRASFSSADDNVPRLIVTPDYTRLSCSDADDMTYSRVFYTLDEDRLKLAINWLPEDGAPPGAIYSEGGYVSAERDYGIFLGHARGSVSGEDNFFGFTDAQQAWFMAGLWQYAHNGNGKASMFLHRSSVAADTGGTVFSYGATQVGTNIIQGTWGTDPNTWAYLSAANTTTFTISRSGPAGITFPAGQIHAMAMATNL